MEIIEEQQFAFGQIQERKPMDQQTMGWVLLGAAVLILALLIYLLTQVKKS